MARILVVDDDKLTALLVERTLGNANYECEIAGTAEQALVALTKRDFDLVISDIVLPGLRGTDLLRELRRRTPRIPVILTTAYASIPAAMEAIREGAFGYLAKPANDTDLLMTVAHALEMDRLARANDTLRKEAFILRNISHEIRTPLSAVLNGSELIVKALKQDGGNGGMADVLKAIEEGCSRLTYTVDILLEMAALQGGEVKPAPVAIMLGPFVEEIARQFFPHARKKALTLECAVEDPHAKVMFDRQGLGSALSKLLDNAIKFTPRGGIFLRVYRNQAGTCCLDVRDTGVGISDTRLPEVFAAFSQAKEGNDRPYQGLGLGLAVAQKHLELNGARLLGYSIPGEGSTFTMVFSSTEAA